MKTEEKLYELYDEMLDEVYEDVLVAGFVYNTSRVLRALDPIAYNCGFHDWTDSEGWVEEASSGSVQMYSKESDLEDEDSEDADYDKIGV